MAYDQTPVRPGAVWITRAQPGAAATAARVADLGFAPLVAPLLKFAPLAADLALRVGEALAFTSLNGASRAAALTDRRDAPVFAVGDSTARAARALGFIDVRSAGGDVVALAAVIATARPESVLHPCARETAGDLVGLLTAMAVEARKIAVYETLTPDALPAAVVQALGDRRLIAALFHSPKAARTAAALAGEQNQALGAVTAVGLSDACVAPLNRMGFHQLIAAPAPTELALMQSLAAAFTPKP